MRAGLQSSRRSPVGNGSTKEQILQRAGELFLERGYRGTSVEAIANEVGITSAAIYWHFDSKADLLLAFLESTFPNVLDRIDAGELRTATERLRQIATTHTMAQLETVAQMPGRQLNFTGRQLLQSLPPRMRRRLERAQDDYVHLCAEVLREGVRTGEFDCAQPVPTAFAIVNMCEDANLWYRLDGPLSVNELANLYGELAVRMVAKVASPSSPPSTPSPAASTPAPPGGQRKP